MMYLVSILDPKMSEEIIIPKHYLEGKFGTFKLTLHLKNDAIGDKYVETIFDYN